MLGLPALMILLLCCFRRMLFYCLPLFVDGPMLKQINARIEKSAKCAADVWSVWNVSMSFPIRLAKRINDSHLFRGLGG
jgi:hypothetical protein